jgi:D-xylose transport system ATP-binding protein
MTMPSATATAPPQGEDSPILSLRAVNKSFGAVHVLQDVDFDAYLGEVTALVGDNGAGKSTLIKGVAGSHLFDSDLALCDNLDIVNNLYLGRELIKRGVLDEATMEKRATETLAGLSVRTVRSIRQQVASLSGGQRQTVAIARSVLWNSKVVILDEPTAALGVAQTEQVLRLVRRLADRGLAVVLISHNLNDVFAVADRISVLYLGRMAANVKAKDVTSNQVVELITTSRSGSIGLSRDVEPDAVELQEGIAEDAASDGQTVSTPTAGTREDTP